MASNIILFASLLCCLLASSLAKPNQGGPEISLRGLDGFRLAPNTVAIQGTNVTLTCSAAPGINNPRIQWLEYASSEVGNLISDGNFVLPGHPSSARFSIDNSVLNRYDLTIHDVARSDGGRYVCVDTFAPATEIQRHFNYLTVLDGPQQCITTVPSSGVTIEDTYYTYECMVNYGGDIFPSMRWSGPEPFGQAQSDNGQSVWSGLSFYAHRTMSNQYWDNHLNFSDAFLPVPPDTANNIPTYVDSFATPRIQVNWPPKGMYADPIRPLNEYLVGDTIECFADAFPTATYEWHNLRTNERIQESRFTIQQDWEGTNQQMRCDAYNTINGFRFNREHHITVNVPVPPTTPTTTPPTTTTPPPPEAPCTNLEGRWESVSPLPAFMCLEVNETNGNIHGVIRNTTDTYWIDLVGSTNLPAYDHACFTGIWALNRAVSTFISECSRCFGEEILIVSAISRSKGGPPCGQPGQIFYSQEYEFRRNPTVSCPPISPP